MMVMVVSMSLVCKVELSWDYISQLKMVLWCFWSSHMQIVIAINIEIISLMYMKGMIAYE